MEITLSPASAARIRDVLGESVDLSPAAVPHVLARLAEEAPDVYSRVLGELSGSQIRLDSERTLHLRHRRAALRRLLFGWGEYDSDAGDRVLAKRRLAAAVPVGLAALMLIVAGLSALAGRPHRGVSASAPARPLRLSPPRASFTARPRIARSVAPHATRSAPSASAVRPVPPASPPAGTSRLGLHGGGPQIGPQDAPASQFPPLPSVPPPPFFRDRPPVDGGTSSRREAAPPSPVVFSRTPRAESVSLNRSDAGPRSPVVYTREGAGRAATPPGRRVPASGSAFRRGDQIAARLATGVIVAPGGPPLPVVVTGVADGSTWLGHAVAGSGDRVEISLELIGEGARRPGTSAGRTGPIRGVVLDRERLAAGLPARIVVRRYRAAAAAVRSLVQAASDYLQALARAGQITVIDGAGQLTVGDAAPGWTYAAARLAENLTPQQSGDVPTMDLAAGTPCVVLVTEAP